MRIPVWGAFLAVSIALLTPLICVSSAEPLARLPESAAPTTVQPPAHLPSRASVEAEARSYLTNCHIVASNRLDECRTYQQMFVENYAWAIQEGDTFAQQGISRQLLTGDAGGILILRPNRLQACAWALARVVRALDQTDEHDARDIERLCASLDVPSLHMAKVRAAQLATEFAPTQR